jgi:predicted enzyme related to lactoylglutathione lyase
MAGVMKLPPEARAMKTPPMWLAYVGVPDTHVSAWDAQRLGAKLHKGPQKTPTVGTWAVLQDPQGASFAIHQPDQNPQVGEEPGIGDFSWHELATTDHRAAFDFYQQLFGWENMGAVDMGPAGEYLMYGIGKQTFGGMYTKGTEMPGPPAWNSYIRVADVQPVTKALVAAGGKVANGPMEVPGGDWITMANDPQGAFFAVHAKPKKAAKPAARKKVTKSTAKKAKSAKTRPSQKAKRLPSKTSTKGKKRKK